MGAVYRAEDRVLSRTVAVKVLPLGTAGEDPSRIHRFEREARAAASLWHPNIVSVFDAGADGTTRFIVMEHVEGMSLAELLSREGPLPVDRAVDIATQIASGLAAAHRAGIVHRDVKPANVMIDASGTVKLLDFGIARAGGGTTLTEVGSVIGSALYMAPEVAVGGAAEERSDVYSLGCVLYEMVTGRPPFPGELSAAVLHQHVNGRPRPPRELAPEIPPPLDETIMQTLSKHAPERPGAALLGAALARTPRSGGQERAPRRTGPGRVAREAALPPRRPPAGRVTDETAPLSPRRPPHGGAAPQAVPTRRRPRHAARLALAVPVVAMLAAIGFALGASDSNNTPALGRGAAGLAAQHRSARGTDRNRSWRLLPAGTGAAFGEAEQLVSTYVAANEAAQAPVVTAPPPPASAPHRGHGHSGKGPKHAKNDKHSTPSRHTDREREPASREPEAEAAPSGAQEEAPSVETPPAEAPPSSSSGGPPGT